MKHLGFDSDHWYMLVFSFLTGRNLYNNKLPENTCQLFWQSVKMLVFLPLTFIGSIALYLVEDSPNFKGLWARALAQFITLFIYFAFLIVGDSFIGSVILDIPEKELALTHLGWAAWVYLPIIGMLLLAIPIAIIAGIGYSIWYGVTKTKEALPDTFEETFGIEIDNETELPKNKFWAVLYSIHDKTCAKIDWK